MHSSASSRTPRLTAMIVIEELHLRVTSYTNGMLKLTNINKPAINKVVGMYHSPTGEFPTAMGAITGQT